MDASGLPVSRAQCEWFYRRSGLIMRSPFMLNSDWFDPDLKEYLAPNLVAEAAKDLAIAHAGLREGRRVGRLDEAVAVAAEAAGVDRLALHGLAQSPEVAARARATTAEFHALQVKQRPAFLLENSIGDRAVFSGLAVAAPLSATIEAMLDDAAAYAAHGAHFGGPPEA